MSILESTEDFRRLKDTIDDGAFDIFACIDHLQRYAHVIGIHHYLCRRLRTYAYDELEFFIPQFTQLLVNVETNSLALEEFMMAYCRTYPHFSMLCYWNLQAHLFELASDTDTYSFQITRKMINALQQLLFSDTYVASPVPGLRAVPMRENLYPSLIMASMATAAAVAMPGLGAYAMPLVETQGRQERSMIFKLANFQKKLTRNLTLKNRKMAGEGVEIKQVKPAALPVAEPNPPTLLNSTEPQRPTPLNSAETQRPTLLKATTEPLPAKDHPTGDDLVPFTASIGTMSITRNKKLHGLYQTSNSTGGLSPGGLPVNESFHSLPDLKRSDSSSSLPHRHSSSRRNSVSSRRSISSAYSDYLSDLLSVSRTHSTSRGTPLMSPAHRVHTLTTNYYKREYQFCLRLNDISHRLLVVPRAARLGTLRAELALLNHDLPSEVDIPVLMPAGLTRKGKFHQILKLNINEAAVLNLAERVPFLLLVEYLADEIDFDPSSEANGKIIERELAARAAKLSTTEPATLRLMEQPLDSAEGEAESTDETTAAESDLGDLNVVKMRNALGGAVASAHDPHAAGLAEQMRIAAVMLQQLEASATAPLTTQSGAIRERIISSMQLLQDQFEAARFTPDEAAQDAEAGNRKLENDLKVTGGTYLGETWHKKRERIKRASAYGHLENWELCLVIVKNGDDLTQEAFACQLIAMISLIWQKQLVPVWTKKMRILITSANHGLVETITDALLVHSIKKTLFEMKVAEGGDPRTTQATLTDHFLKSFGDPRGSAYRRAQANFASSLAAYSVICYVLQIKDRHNGNIMLDNEGHVMHIDFGFLLSNSPGGMGFEAAPFKLPWEYVDLLGGPEGEPFALFRSLVKQCYACLCKNSSDLVAMVELMQKDSALPCFKNGSQTSVQLKARLMADASDQQRNAFVDTYLIGKSMGSRYTRLYDQFQLMTQGIYS